MSNTPDPETKRDHSMIYQIRIKGLLGPQWAGWFDGMTITRDDNGETLVTGPVIDQAALHGLIKKVRDLGLPLISVTRVDHDHSEPTEA